MLRHLESSMCDFDSAAVQSYYELEAEEYKRKVSGVPASLSGVGLYSESTLFPCFTSLGPDAFCALPLAGRGSDTRAVAGQAAVRRHRPLIR